MGELLCKGLMDGSRLAVDREPWNNMVNMPSKAGGHGYRRNDLT